MSRETQPAKPWCGGSTFAPGSIISWCIYGFPDSRGRLLIQKRASHLKLMPGIWAATGGSAIAGEESEGARAAGTV